MFLKVVNTLDPETGFDPMIESSKLSTALTLINDNEKYDLPDDVPCANKYCLQRWSPLKRICDSCRTRQPTKRQRFLANNPVGYTETIFRKAAPRRSKVSCTTI